MKQMKIRFDDRNFNAHTKEGMELLERSVGKVGIIESVTVSNDDVILSGNARKKTFDNLMPDAEPIIIETDGTRPVILKRTDIESGSREFYEAALLANTTAQKNINLDEDRIREVLIEELEIDVVELGIENIEIIGDDELFGRGTKTREDNDYLTIRIDTFNFMVRPNNELYELVVKLKENLETPCEKKELEEKILKLCKSVF